MSNPAPSCSRPLTLASIARGLCWFASHVAGNRRKVASPWHTINRRRAVDNFPSTVAHTYAHFLSSASPARKPLILFVFPYIRTKLFISSASYNGRYVN
jgi:hypothetical protein